MNGCIINNTPIAVDYWRPSKDAPNLVHFLSHLHSDHTSGLSSSWRRPIYCSEVTGRLLQAKFQVRCSLIKTLPIGQPNVIPLTHGESETMTVTLIDANHCPGAVMFLFEGYFGNILYTADFHYTPAMFSDAGLGASLLTDILYLDNTFNDPRCVWPSNEVSAKSIETLISTFINSSDIVIALHSLGKEELLVQIAKKFNRWIVVTPARYEMLQLIEMPNVFTMDPEASNIRVVNQSAITWKKMIDWNSSGKKTIVIVPSALFKISKTKKAYDHPNVYLEPYTCHSSHAELMEFVSKVKPRTIIPIVKERGSSCNVSNFHKYLRKAETGAANKMPESVKSFRKIVCKPNSLYKKKNKRHDHTEKVPKRKIACGVVFDNFCEEPALTRSLSLNGVGNYMDIEGAKFKGKSDCDMKPSDDDQLPVKKKLKLHRPERQDFHPNRCGNTLSLETNKLDATLPNGVVNSESMTDGKNICENSLKTKKFVRTKEQHGDPFSSKIRVESCNKPEDKIGTERRKHSADCENRNGYRSKSLKVPSRSISLNGVGNYMDIEGAKFKRNSDCDMKPSDDDQLPVKKKLKLHRPERQDFHPNRCGKTLSLETNKLDATLPNGVVNSDSMTDGKNICENSLKTKKFVRTKEKHGDSFSRTIRVESCNKPEDKIGTERRKHSADCENRNGYRSKSMKVPIIAVKQRLTFYEAYRKMLSMLQKK